MQIFETVTRYNYPVHHHRHLVENCQLQHVVPGETMDGETCGNCLTLARRRFCHHHHLVVIVIVVLNLIITVIIVIIVVIIFTTD